PIVLVTLHLLEAAPPQIADEEVFHPGEQEVDPVLEIAVQIQVRTAEIKARLANNLSLVILTPLNLDNPPLADRTSPGLKEHEAQLSGVWMKLVGVKEPEIDAAQPRAVEPGNGGAFEFGMVDCRQLRLARGREKGILIGHNPARDHDLTRKSPVDVIDIG